MNVEELIKELEKMPPKMRVVDYLGEDITEVNVTRRWFTDSEFESVVEVT